METLTEIQPKSTVSYDLAHRQCLNCNNDVTNNFCSACGQKLSTHRYSLQHFFAHDLVHGVFHLDKGFFYTLKELFTRPGHSIREFVEGKRVNHFNYFSFALIILVVEYYVIDSSSLKSRDLYDDMDKYAGFQKVAKEYFKLVSLAGIPFFALTSYFIFRKSKQNYTEHLVLNIYRVSIILIINVLYIAVTVFYTNVQVLSVLMKTVPSAEIIYSSWFFFQYFSVFGYKKWTLIFRSILASMILVIINNGFISFAVNEIGKHFFK